jgi:hypothetical protein
MRYVKKCLVGVSAIASLLYGEALLTVASTFALPAQKTPVIIAQRSNERIAVLRCGQYNITIAYVGATGSNRFSYRTKGLFLRNGTMAGNDYVFYNNDFEYRTTLNFNSSNDTQGTGRLQVAHYGETILDKPCTWSN